MLKRSVKVCICAVLMYVFTNWPWKTIVEIMKILIKQVKYEEVRLHLIPSNDEADDPQDNDQADDPQDNDQADDPQDNDQADDLQLECCQSSVTEKCDRCYCFKCLGFAFLRSMYILIFIGGAIVLQWITCFSRDRVNADLEQINNTKKLNCKEMNGIFGSFLLPGLVILLLAFWVYVVLKLGSRCHECLRKYLEWDELNVLETDGAENLNELVEAVKSKLSKPHLVIGYTVIPILYILLSLVLSIGYLFVFHLRDEDVYIQTPWRKWQLSGGTKNTLLALTICGFILLDILYLTVIMRYVYRCQMIIYYLQLIWDKVENRRYTEHDEAMEDVKKANKFISYLNASSGTTGFITLISVYQATSCAFILSNYVTFSQALVIAPRLILWGFLAIFPFYKAARLNASSEKISATGFCMRLPPPVFDNDRQNTGISQHNGQTNTGNSQQNPESGHRLNEGYLINLQATMFGISVRPWLPYLVIILLLLTIILQSSVGKINIPYKLWQ